MIDCGSLSLRLADASERPAGLGSSARVHVESCLRCQAELASYRKLRRSLGGLRSVEVEVDARFVEELLSQFRPSAVVHPLRRGPRRRAYVGGVVAAMTAAGAGAMVLAVRFTTRSAIAG